MSQKKSKCKECGEKFETIASGLAHIKVKHGLSWYGARALLDIEEA